MTVEEQNAKLEKGYTEAMRYMANAKDTLAKSKKDEYHYSDKKYVRTACGTAYNGVLIALETWLANKGVAPPLSKKQRKSINYYTDTIAKYDKKLLDDLDSAYGILHLEGYYDGRTSVKLIAAGFELAHHIIERIKPVTVV